MVDVLQVSPGTDIPYYFHVGVYGESATAVSREFADIARQFVAALKPYIRIREADCEVVRFDTETDPTEYLETGGEYTVRNQSYETVASATDRYLTPVALRDGLDAIELDGRTLLYALRSTRVSTKLTASGEPRWRDRSDSMVVTKDRTSDPEVDPFSVDLYLTPPGSPYKDDIQAVAKLGIIGHLSDWLGNADDMRANRDRFAALVEDVMDRLDVLWVSERFELFAPDTYVSTPPEKFLDLPDDG